MSFGSTMKSIRESNQRRIARGFRPDPFWEAITLPQPDTQARIDARKRLTLDPFWEEIQLKKDPAWQAAHPHESGTKEERIARGRKIIEDIESRPAPTPPPPPPPGRSGPAKWVEVLDSNGNLMRALHDHRFGGDVSFDAQAHTAVFRCADCGDEYEVDTSG